MMTIKTVPNPDEGETTKEITRADHKDRPAARDSGSGKLLEGETTKETTRGDRGLRIQDLGWHAPTLEAIYREKNLSTHAWRQVFLLGALVPPFPGKLRVGARHRTGTNGGQRGDHKRRP